MSEDHLKSDSTWPALDDNLYNLNEEQLDFFKKTTQINNDEELKKHILEVQAEAYKVGLC
jgi:hypothetical protein